MKSKNFIINLISNIGTLLVSVALAFWTTSFTINRLGADAYGFIPLVQSIINYLTVVTVAIDSMVGRFFTYSVKSGDVEDANEYINTSFFTCMVMCAILLVPILIMALKPGYFLNIPERLLYDVKISIILQGLILITSTISTIFGSAAYCMNKLYINNVVQVVNILLRASFLVCLFLLITPHIWYVSLSNVMGAVAGMLISIYFFKKLMPHIKFRPGCFKFTKFKKLISAGMWNSINYMGSLLYLQSDMLVANWMLGATISGEYSALLQLSLLIRMLANTVSSAFSPMYVTLYAEKRMSEMIDLSKKAICITGFTLALPIGILGGMGKSIAMIWLGPSFASYQWIMLLMAVSLAINTPLSPLFAIFLTYNKVKIPAVAQVIVGILNFAIGITLTGVLKWGVYGIAVTGIISYTIINYFIVAIYTAHLSKQKAGIYQKQVLRSLLCTVAVGAICYSIQWLIPARNIYYLVLYCFIIGILYIPVCFFGFLNTEERKDILDYVNIFIKRKVNLDMQS